MVETSEGAYESDSSAPKLIPKSIHFGNRLGASAALATCIIGISIAAVMQRIMIGFTSFLNFEFILI